MAAALNNAREPELSKDDDPIFKDLMTDTFPKYTVKNALNRLGNNPMTPEKVFPILKYSLLPKNTVLFPQCIICNRGEEDNGILRKETTQFIVVLCGERSDKQAENHPDYLIRTERLDKLKRNGTVVAA